MSMLLKRPVVRNSLIVLVGVLYLLPLILVNGAVDMFLKIEGVDGESTDAKHKEWIDISSFSHGVSKPVTGSGPTRSSGATSFQEITVTKWIDKSSPILMLSTCDGRHFPKVELAVRRPGLSGSGTETYYTYTLADVLVSSVQSGGTGGSDAVPSEQISLNFTKIEFNYQEVADTGESVFQTNVTCVVE